MALRKALGAATVLVCAASVITPPAAAAAAPDTTTAPPDVSPRTAVIAEPDGTLGAGWRKSSDLLVAGHGDLTGFHVYVAREKDAYAWRTLATLNPGLPEAGEWTGYVCVTGTNRYAAVVYAPKIATNKPAMLTAGAFAAIVDIRTGKVRELTERVQLGFDTPACGAQDRVLFTRALGANQELTDVISVSAVTGRVQSTRRVKAQLTNPAPDAGGDLGVVGGNLVRLDAKGRFRSIGRPGGQPYAVRPTAKGAIDVLTVEQVSGGKSERSAAYRYVGTKKRLIARSDSTAMELLGLGGGRNLLVGDVPAVKAVDGLATWRTTGRPRAVSRNGGLVTLSLGVANAAPAKRNAAQPAGASPVLGVTVQSTRTGKVSKGELTTEPASPGATPLAAAGPSDGDDPYGFGLPAPDAPRPGSPRCGLPRNDVRIQVPQPSANQVEWAVDRAVQGKLTTSRPAGYLNGGQPAYTPQGMFPLPSSGPRVPAQLMLAILAQETNMAQASWHSVPGDAGNPLISDYYGLRATPGAPVTAINYASSDCGYGIGQVTDSMTVGGRSTAQQMAIAKDYQANIAASLQILVQKWNQLRTADAAVNNSDPQYIENWYLAVWGYNSGIYTDTSGPHGVGWLNNPANPRYPANRDPFLRLTRDDASHPSDWSYPEKIMGWAETPQFQWDLQPNTKYSKPITGASSPPGYLMLPGRYAFCSAVNNCSAGLPANPCPSVDSKCWWHGRSTWVPAGQEAAWMARENLAFSATSSEPAVIRAYARPCGSPAMDNLLAVIVDDVDSAAEEIQGCSQAKPWGGKFTIRTGYPPGSGYANYGQVDLHQLGAGYRGHTWFSYSKDPTRSDRGGLMQKYWQQTIGTWTPDLPREGMYHIWAHLPSHGAQAKNAEYVFKVPGMPDPPPCLINQDITKFDDVWVSLGTLPLTQGTRVQLSNLVPGGEGKLGIAWDAMAFVESGGSTFSCGAYQNRG